jgi:hypothetical protein
MEPYQRDLLKQVKAYTNIKGMEWKKITTTIIAQYRKIDEPAFQTGLNTRIIVGPTGKHYYKWLLGMIRWTLETRQDLVSRNIWPKTETSEDTEMTPMPMHQESGSRWNHNNKYTTSWNQSGTLPRWKTIPNSITTSFDTQSAMISLKQTTSSRHQTTKMMGRHQSCTPTYFVVPTMRELVQPP